MSFSSFLASSQLIFRASAQVVRVELAAPVQARVGFAAAIKTFTLRNDKKKLIERGIVGEGLKDDKFARKKTLIKSGTSPRLLGVTTGCGFRSAALLPSQGAELPPNDVVFGSSTAGEAVRLSAEMAATAHYPCC